MTMLVTLVAAVIGGELGLRIRLPGGRIVGSLCGAAAATLSFGAVIVPEPVRLLIFVGVGMMIGMMVTRETVRTLPATALQAVLSAVLLIAAGLGVTLLLRALDMAPTGDVLATSPGALSVLGAAAAENGLGAPTVALFHVVRIVLVLLSLPLLLKLLPGPAPEPQLVSVPAAPGESREVAPRSGPSPEAMPAGRGQVAYTALASTAAGLLAMASGVGGALIFATTLAAAAVTVASAEPRRCPRWIRTSVQVGLGWMIGTRVTPDTLVALQDAFVPALIAGVLVVAAGVAVAFGMRMTGLAPPGDVLATSPGAVEALAAVAAEHDAGAVQVALFHTVRILLVIASLPLLLHLAQ